MRSIVVRGVRGRGRRALLVLTMVGVVGGRDLFASDRMGRDGL
jgi:hypothetical protein